MRQLRVLLPLLVVLAVASPAAAHNLVVNPNGQGPTTTHWVGGGPVPGQGAGLIASPMGTLPAAHGAGLVQACTSANGSGAVTFIAPPFFIPDTDCRHGEGH
jgi:hypothetical protein